MPIIYSPPNPLLRRFNTDSIRLILPVVVRLGESITDAIALGLLHLSAIVIPTSWTPANLTFQSSVDGVTWGDVYDGAGNEYKLNVQANGSYILLDSSAFYTMNYVKIRSGTTATPVPQTAERSLQLVIL